MKPTIILVLFLCSTVTGFSRAPVIASSSPPFWATNVNPSSQKEISVTFDQRLRYGFSSWIGPSSVIPETVGDSKMGADARSSSVSVKLEPGKVYVFALNEKSISGVGFQ